MFFCLISADLNWFVDSISLFNANFFFEEFSHFRILTAVAIIILKKTTIRFNIQCIFLNIFNSLLVFCKRSEDLFAFFFSQSFLKEEINVSCHRSQLPRSSGNLIWVLIYGYAPYGIFVEFGGKVLSNATPYTHMYQ